MKLLTLVAELGGALVEYPTDTSMAMSAAKDRNILPPPSHAKLVPQNANDRPAGVLLESIRAVRFARTVPRVSARRMPNQPQELP